MTVLPELIPIMIDMVINKVTGTINLTNPGLITHNEILEMYKEIIDPSFTWKNMNLEEQTNLLAAGRSNNYLDVSRLKELYPNVKHIKDSVRECLIKYKENTTE
jgi:3,5-epimerase/4-reductase